MRDYNQEVKNRVLYIREIIEKSGAEGIVFGNSGGKDCTLAGILCKMACDNTVSVMLPCQSKQNFGSDIDDAKKVCEKFNIENRMVDLSNVKESLIKALEGKTELNNNALTNMAPRLRMTTLYSIGASENRLVAGTGNKSEYYMGYFTKWGDGAYDFNPIADLTVTEVYEFLKFLKVPETIINKAPSAGLFEGQTDEKEMGVTYPAIDMHILFGKSNEKDKKIIERYHSVSEHKRKMPPRYGE